MQRGKKKLESEEMEVLVSERIPVSFSKLKVTREVRIFFFFSSLSYCSVVGGGLVFSKWFCGLL